MSQCCRLILLTFFLTPPFNRVFLFLNTAYSIAFDLTLAPTKLRTISRMFTSAASTDHISTLALPVKHEDFLAEISAGHTGALSAVRCRNAKDIAEHPNNRATNARRAMRTAAEAYRN